MTTKQPRLGTLTDEATRALDLIQLIAAVKQPGPAFWQGFLARVVQDLDEVGAVRDVTRIADLLVVAYGRLEDKPETPPAEAGAETEELARLMREWRARG